MFVVDCSKCSGRASNGTMIVQKNRVIVLASSGSLEVRARLVNKPPVFEGYKGGCLITNLG
jgi:hypothetical protein